jgi:hypothetical protein
MNSAGPVCDDGDLTTLEFVCESPVPEDYQAFLRRWNGGAPQCSGLVTKDDADAVAILYSVRARIPLHDLLIRHQALRGIVPKMHLAIGAFESSALLVMSLEPPPRFGAMFHLALRVRSERKSRLRFVAPSFTALQSKLS